MIDYFLVWFVIIGYVKKLAKMANQKRPVIASHIGKLGTAAYTSAFVYAIEKGIDFNVLKLTLIGVVVVAMAEKLNR